MGGTSTRRTAVGAQRDIHERLELLEFTVGKGNLPGRLSAQGQRVADWDEATMVGFYWSDAAALNNPVGNIAVGGVTAYGPDGTYERIMQEVMFPTAAGDPGPGQSKTWRRVGQRDNATAWSWTSWVQSDLVQDAQLPARLGVLAKDVSGQSLNSLTETGWYRGNNMGSGPNGAGWWYIEVIAHDAASWRLQRVTGYTNPGAWESYERQQTSGTWGGWQRVYRTAAEVDSRISNWALPGVISNVDADLSTGLYIWNDSGGGVAGTLPPNTYGAMTYGTLKVIKAGNQQQQWATPWTSPTPEWYRVKMDGGSWGAWRIVQGAPTLVGPYSMAGGRLSGVSVAAGGITNTAVTFPASRFSVAPLVMVTQVGTDYRDITCGADAVTASGMTVWRGSAWNPGTARSGVLAEWTAVQMTASSATG